MILTIFFSLVFALVFFAKEKSSIFVAFYLSTLPFIIFFGQSPVLLILSLLLGSLLYHLFQKDSVVLLIAFLVFLGITVFISHPRLGIDQGMLNVVNSQRGEHPLFETSVYARLIHNKTELIHPFIFNVDKLLSPAAIFASGFWHYVSPYYPLGFLFPWDIYFIFRYLRFRTNNTKKKSGIFFVPVLILLFVLTGILYIDQAVTFSFAVLYFLALLAAKGYLTTSSKTRIVFTLINFVYLLYHLSTINYFKI